MASFLVFGALELLQRGACPAAYFLQLSIFRNVEVALALASWSILPPPPPPPPPTPPRQSAVCKMPSCPACLHPGKDSWRGTGPKASFGA